MRDLLLIYQPPMPSRWLAAWLGYSLEIGWALRGGVSRSQNGRWKASLNAMELDEWPTVEEAMASVERRITTDVTAIMEDWAIWQQHLNSPDFRAAKKRLL
jgi:hypothetical protein